MENTKILLLDDREENLISLRAILNRDDIQIYATTSANDALRIVWENDISVALVDVQMPGMDGFEFAETLASNPKTKEILIVFVTAISKETRYAVKGLKTGAIDYLYKPLDPYITSAKVDALVKLARSQREIREKNRMLENYAAIVTNSPDIIATVVPESGKILSVNPSVEIVLGHTPESLLNTSIIDLLVSPEGSPLQKILIERSYVSGETIVLEDQFFGTFRQHVWLELHLMYRNRVLFLNLHDIEKRKAHERELIKAQNQAEKARRAKESFLANMSHEIRTPLNGIIGLGNLLETTALDESQKGLLEMLLQSSSSLLNILNDILDISKIDEGKFSIIPSATDLRNIGKGIVDLMRFKADEKDLKINLTVDESVPACVMVDGMRLNQILLNLVGNALKFTTEGYVNLIIKNEGSKNGKYLLRFSVEDSGIGISEANVANIFSEYGQASDEISHQYGGTGLGLTISQKLVHLLGGELKVQSKLGSGSQFFFTLELENVEEEINKKSQYIPFHQLPPFPGKKILIAEDNRINGLLLEKYLAAWQIDTVLVLNGKEAIRELQSTTYDMVVMDTRMPEMDGFQAARYTRNEIGLDTPILSLSATILPEEIEQAILSGMNDTLSKPFEPMQLHEKIGILMNKE
ncbi:Sensor histidine kinase RcsC [Dyadobacter sp. CECT 9275]|uniref:Sensory/regulatory protein RpfC n=1 Tax=Dyadobacter helix TaxID=2822344 RepID=A0A916JA97_9BACT|nr:response regulator [Dyadobacter sp. CECT 9275]CAG4997954.1 Sensor histidine kinase RcsC [Dyadobacter sp. CECT 9275]